jgi:hypothetical protein
LNLSSLSGRIVSLLSMLWHKKKYFFLSSIRPYIIKQSTAVYAQQMCINNHQEGVLTLSTFMLFVSQESL